jgi:hypothetical protein
MDEVLELLQRSMEIDSEENYLLEKKIPLPLPLLTIMAWHGLAWPEYGILTRPWNYIARYKTRPFEISKKKLGDEHSSLAAFTYNERLVRDTEKQGKLHNATSIYLPVQRTAWHGLDTEIPRQTGRRHGCLSFRDHSLEICMQEESQRRAFVCHLCLQQNVKDSKHARQGKYDEARKVCVTED